MEFINNRKYLNIRHVSEVLKYKINYNLKSQESSFFLQQKIQIDFTKIRFTVIFTIFFLLITQPCGIFIIAHSKKKNRGLLFRCYFDNYLTTHICD